MGTTVRWFGESWGAPVNEWTQAITVPVGRPCCYCRKPIEAHDRGFMLPMAGGAPSPSGIVQLVSGPYGPELVATVVYHFTCQLRALGVVTVHILHHGRPLCGFSAKVPGEWPRGHIWTRLETADQSNCTGCCDVHKLLRE